MDKTPQATTNPTPDHNDDARAKFEAARLTRRQALAKFGFGAGAAALLALSSDDIARMAAAKLKQHAGDNQIAHLVANELKDAGVAHATDN